MWRFLLHFRLTEIDAHKIGKLEFAAKAYTRRQTDLT
jgi:hypothetical protein